MKGSGRGETTGVTKNSVTTERVEEKIPDGALGVAPPDLTQIEKRRVKSNGSEQCNKLGGNQGKLGC